jgi:hypothetical protein
VPGQRRGLAVLDAQPSVATEGAATHDSGLGAHAGFAWNAHREQSVRAFFAMVRASNDVHATEIARCSWNSPAPRRGADAKRIRGARATLVPAPRAQWEPWNDGLGGAGDASCMPSALGLVKREDTLKSNLVRYSIGGHWFFAALALPALALGCAAGGGGSSSAGDDPPAPTGPLAPAPAAPVMRAPAVPNPMAAPPASSSSATPASAASGTSRNAGSETSPDPNLDVNAPAPAAGEPGAEPGSDLPPTPPADDTPAGGDEEDEDEEDEEDEDD